MKKNFKFILLLILLIGFNKNIFASFYKRKNIPSPVKEYIISHYPKAQKIHAEIHKMNNQEKGYFITFFNTGKLITIHLDNQAHVLLLEEEIFISELSEQIRNDLFGYKIKKIFIHTCPEEKYYIVDAELKDKVFYIEYNEDGSLKHKKVVENKTTMEFFKITGGLLFIILIKTSF